MREIDHRHFPDRAVHQLSRHFISYKSMRRNDDIVIRVKERFAYYLDDLVGTLPARIFSGDSPCFSASAALKSTAVSKPGI